MGVRGTGGCKGARGNSQKLVTSVTLPETNRAKVLPGLVGGPSQQDQFSSAFAVCEFHDKKQYKI